MRDGSSLQWRRMGWSAILVAAWMGICGWGAASTADAQLLPNAPIKRQRPPCDQELPIYQKYRAVYYGYHPTCWRQFPPDWGCPSPAKANVQEEYRKLPLNIPKDEDKKSDETDPDADPDADADPKLPKDEEGDPAMPGDDKADPSLPGLPGETDPDAKKEGAEMENDPAAAPNPNPNPNGDADAGASAPGDQETALPPLPAQYRDRSLGIPEMIPPVAEDPARNAMDRSRQPINLPVLPPDQRLTDPPVRTLPASAPGATGMYYQVPRPASAVATQAQPSAPETRRDRRVQAAVAGSPYAPNFDYHAGQSRFAPQSSAQPQPQVQAPRRAGLLQGLFRGRR